MSVLERRYMISFSLNLPRLRNQDKTTGALQRLATYIGQFSWWQSGGLVKLKFKIMFIYVDTDCPRILWT